MSDLVGVHTPVSVVLRQQAAAARAAVVVVATVSAADTLIRYVFLPL